MWTEIKAAYRGGITAAIAFPALVLIPAVAEFSQHIVEYRAGMFTSLAGMRAAADASDRMGFGLIKVLSLYLLIYWMSRALAIGDGARLRMWGDARSARLFAGVLAWSIGTGLLQLFGGSFLAIVIPSARAIIAIGAVFLVALIVIDIYVGPWKVGASLGNSRLTIPASFRLMNGNFWWSFGYFLVIFLPSLVVHYLLNGLAIGRPEAALWPILLVDAAVVGVLGLIGGAALYVTARRATARKGAALLP